MNTTAIRAGIVNPAKKPLAWIALTAILAAPTSMTAHADGPYFGPGHPYQVAQFDPDRRRPEPIPWSFASSQPYVPQDGATGLYIWHHRNTVHVESTDSTWFGARFEGAVEIVHGKFDNVKNEHDRDDAHFRQVASNRLVFMFNANRPDVTGFKFNIHDGDRLVFHIGMNGQHTGRIFYGADLTPAGTDPVTFDLRQ
jgi:hypothetical protein